MKTVRQLSTPVLIFDHFYIGVLITIFYVIASPAFVRNEFPGMAALLAAEILILAPVGVSHMLMAGYRLNGNLSLKNVFPFTRKISKGKFILWTIGGLAAIILLYAPLYPVGQWLRHSVFNWLPEWYFNPSAGSVNNQLIARTFLWAIAIDGLVGPVVEELFFRGYLLPRMNRFGAWAPVLNGIMFGLYHLWQPHNLIAVIGIGIIISWIVWKTRNMYLGLVIHCILNILGAIGGYYAIMSGTVIAR